MRVWVGRKKVDKLVCLFLLHSFVCQPCQECASWDLIKTCWASVGDWWREWKNVRAWAADVAMTCMMLEKDVVIVSCPYPWGRWLVRSCEGRTAQKLSVCTLPLCGTFPLWVLTATITSFVNGSPAHIRDCTGGLELPALTYWFLVLLTTNH